MARIIKLRWPAVCRDCGTDLAPGIEARYYGKGRIFGVHCHDKDGNRTSWGPSGPPADTALDGAAQIERDRRELDATEHGPDVITGALAGITKGAAA